LSNRAFILDAGPLGLLAKAKPADADVARLTTLLMTGPAVFLPEIADYEVRRSLLLSGLADSVRELDRLKTNLTYAPITTSVMLRAAGIWADARRVGRPTADRQALDCDVILAAQSLEVGAVIATENVRHLSQYTPTVRWQDIPAI
jgi:predicted nucleic acid-binding protein